MSYFHPPNPVVQNPNKDSQLPLLCLQINAHLAYYSTTELNSRINSNSTTSSSTQRAAKPKLKGEDRSVVRLMCSMGGKVLPRPHDNELRYVGGITHLVTFQRNITYLSFMLKLSKLFNVGNEFTVKYQLPNEGFDNLISVVDDEDVENMMEEFEELNLQRIKNENQNNNNKIIPRMRLLLLPPTREQEIDISRTNSNVSEESDYLFGLENSNSSLSAFGTSLYATQPPVKTKLENPNPNPVEKMCDSKSHQTGGQLWGQGLDPGYPYPTDQAYEPSNLVHYVPAGPGLVVNPHLPQSGQQVQIQVPIRYMVYRFKPSVQDMAGNIVPGQPLCQG